MEDDREQVRRAQQGDLGAYEQLVQRYERKAYGLAFSLMGNREDAEDMLQESFFQAFQALARFRGGIFLSNVVLPNLDQPLS